jgi:tryptophan 7-halogenase
MSEPRELPRRIVVAGDGQVGVLAAIALKRALPSSDVVVVGTPPDPGAIADRAPTALPFTNKLHDRLGIEEDRLVREAGASHRLVVRYRGWGEAGHEGVAAYGAAIDPRLKTGFARDWGGGPRNASTAASPRSIAEVLAAEGRFAPPSGEPDSALADLDYALRWNVPAYRDLLIGEAQRLGVQYIRGAIGAAQPDSEGGIAAIAIEGAGPVEADLFVDCTGQRAALLAQLPEASGTAWNVHSPIRALLFGRPAEPSLVLEDRIDLVEYGWLSQLAGRDGRQAVLALVEGVGEQAALAALSAEPLGFVALEQGCAREPWLGNVVALGDAAAHFEPLGWLNLDLAHRQLALLLELLPGRRPDPRERAEFNRRAALMADRVRDALGAHYAAPGAVPLGTVDRSPELDRTLDQYRRRGRLPFLEESPLLVQEHSALLQALGYRAGEGPLAAAADPREAKAAGAAFGAKAEAALRATPTYPVWLGELLRA